MKSEVEYSGLANRSIGQSGTVWRKYIDTPGSYAYVGNCFWKSFPIRLFVFF